MSGRTENIDIFAFVEFFQSSTGGAEVLAGIEFFGLVVEDLADGSGHGQTAVGVDVDFANSRLGSFTELIFTDTDGVFQFAAVFVDDLDLILRNAGRTVENDRETGMRFSISARMSRRIFGSSPGLNL